MKTKFFISPFFIFSIVLFQAESTVADCILIINKAFAGLSDKIKKADNDNAAFPYCLHAGADIACGMKGSVSGQKALFGQKGNAAGNEEPIFLRYGVRPKGAEQESPLRQPSLIYKGIKQGIGRAEAQRNVLCCF